MIHCFTSAAANYLPKVRILRESLKAYHPEIRFHLLLVDDPPDWLDAEEEAIDSIISLNDLGVADEPGWIFQHNLIELSTALKPLAFLKLFMMENCEAALYFDPDMVIFSQLNDLLDEFTHSSILLTPHQIKPDSDPGAVVDNEIGSLRHGIYNLGFLGVKNDHVGNEFTNWWADRLRYFCLAAFQHGVWVDQRWIDHAPVFFDRVKIIRNARFNVAAWNISQRRLEGGLDGGLSVDQQPLGFYHFSGFDSGAHKIMARKHGDQNRALRQLINWYDIQQEKHKLPNASRLIWTYGSYADGTKIHNSHRFIYRIREDLQEKYKNPFLVARDGESYLDWFTWRANIEHPELITLDGDIKWSSMNDLQIVVPTLASESTILPFNAYVIGLPALTLKAFRLIKAHGLRAFLGKVIERITRHL